MSDKNTWCYMVGCLYFPSPSLNSLSLTLSLYRYIYIYIILIVLLQLYGLGPVTCLNSELLLKLWSTSTSGRTPWTRDQPDASPLPTQGSTIQKHKDKHPCHKRDSNPRSQWPGDQGLGLRLRGRWDRSVLLLLLLLLLFVLLFVFYSRRLFCNLRVYSVNNIISCSSFTNSSGINKVIHSLSDIIFTLINSKFFENKNYRTQ
jgi:hypothetical protein